jgi:hypothetical protein
MTEENENLTPAKETGRKGFRDRVRDEKEFEYSVEVAEDQLAILLDHYEIYPEEFETDGDRTVYYSCASKLITAIRKGRLIIEKETDDLKVTQILRNKTSLSYQELRGKAKAVNYDISRNEEIAIEAAFSRRVYSVMGALSGVGYLGILGLPKEDLAVAEALGFLLLS